MLSLVLTAHNWPAERFDACVASFLRLPAGLLSEVVVLDFGSEEPLVLDLADPRARLIRLEANDWSLAEATNAAILATSGDVVAKTDADVLLGPDSAGGMRRAVGMVASGEYGLMHSQMTDLPPEMSVAEASLQVGEGLRPAGRLRPRWSQGTLPIFKRELWRQLGGYDSRLTGWGLEDNDFSDRARRIGARIGWVSTEDVQVFHVWHPPNYHKTHVARQRLTNKALIEADRTLFRPLRFRASDPSPIVSPQVLRTVAPMVTVAIATAERPGRDRMIAEAIGSFSGQIDGDFEVVVVDNGSDDASFKQLGKTLGLLGGDLNLRLERQAEASIPKARNTIARMARGRFICVADDDDLALSNRLADHLRAFEADDTLHGSHGGWIDFDEESGLIEKNEGQQRSISVLLRGLGKVTNHPSSFYRTDVMRAVPYDEALQLGSDWDLALRAAALELKFGHTGSYVTLRRFHENNVTLTGTSNQVSTGLMARSRTWALYNRRQQAAYDAEARREGGLYACNNDMSVQELLYRLPDYVGQWRLLLPFTDLGVIAADGVPLLQKALEIVDGDVTTMGSGVNQPIMFCSQVVGGTQRARAIIEQFSALLGVVPIAVADRQLTLDRQVPYDWSQIQVPAGGGLVISDRLVSVADALEAMSQLPEGSLLRAAVQVVSDFATDGESHYLAIRPTAIRSEARQMLFELNSLTSVRFRFAAAPRGPGLPTGPSDRFH